MSYEYRKIEQLKPWDKNPRDAKDADINRLCIQLITLKQYKPLVINQDDLVLGGNIRYRGYSKIIAGELPKGTKEKYKKEIDALIDEISTNGISVSVVQTKNENEMLQYALSDNDRIGFYVPEKLESLLHGKTFDAELFKVDMQESSSLGSIMDMFKSAGFDDDNRLDKLSDKKEGKQHECPNCGYKFKD